MQRLFSTFPAGAPGLGLLLLRLALVGVLVVPAQCLWTHEALPVARPLGWVLAVPIAVGLFTPVLTTLTASAGLVGILLGYGGNPFADGVVILGVVALGLIGAGAYSIDARLYGRRQVRIPFD
jgi:hypothetical protein